MKFSKLNFYLLLLSFCLFTIEATQSHILTEAVIKEESLIVEYHSVGGTIISVGLSGLQFFNPGAASAAYIIPLLNLFQSAKYLDLNFPSKLVGTFQKQPLVTTSLNFGHIFLDSFEQNVYEYPAELKFELYGLNGLFLVNFWSGIITFGIVIIAAFAILVLQHLFSENKRLSFIRKKTHTFLVWNFVITLALSNIDRITLFAIIEYRTLDLTSIFPIASYCFNTFFTIGTLFILAYIPRKLYHLRKEEIQHKVFTNKTQAYNSVRVLFESFKNKYFFQQLFLFIIGIRVILHNTIIAALDSPTLQCSLLVTLSVLMLTYSLIFRPHIGVLENIEFVVYETLLLVSNAVCLYISTLETSHQSEAKEISNAIMVSSVLAVAISLLATIFKALIYILNTIQEMLKARVPSQTVPVPGDHDLVIKNNKIFVIKNNKIAEDKSAHQNQHQAPQEENTGKQTTEEQALKESLEIAKITEQHQEQEPPKKIGQEEGRDIVINIKSSMHGVDTQQYPSLEVPEEKYHQEKANPYLVEQSARLGSVTETEIKIMSSRNTLLQVEEI